jgi:streptogramin lyase
MAKTWIDENQNGVWDPGEKPLENVLFYIDDVRNNYQKVGGRSISNLNGEAGLYVWLPGCPDASFEIYPEVPNGYKLTTPERQSAKGKRDEGPFWYGFAPVAGSLAYTRPKIPISCEIHSTEFIDKAFVKIADMEFSKSGELWILVDSLTDFGFAHVNPKDIPEPLPLVDVGIVPKSGFSDYSDVPGMAIAKNGQVWFATDLGALFWNGTVWTTFDTNDGLVSNILHDVAIAPDNTIWFATQRGLSIFEPQSNKWASYPVPKGPDPIDYIWKILVAPDNSLWIVTYRTITRFWPSQDITQQPELQTINAPIEISDSAIAADGSFWVGGQYTEDGSRLDAIGHYDLQTKEWTVYTHKSTHGAMLGDEISSIMVDQEGNVWIGTGDPSDGNSGSGVMLFIPDNNNPDGGDWAVFTTRDGLPGQNIGPMLLETENVVWMSSGGKFARCRIQK